MATLQFAQLSTHLKSPTLAAIYLIASDVTLLQQEVRDAIRLSAKRQGFQQREIHYVESGFNWSHFFQSAQNFNLFSDKTFIEINHASAKFDEKATEGLLTYLKNPPPDKILLVLTDKLTAAQQKTRWYKAIESAGICINIRPVAATELPQWIAQRAEKLQLKLNRESIILLSELTEGNLLATDQALIKLRLIHATATVITPDRLMQAVSDNARYNVFELGQWLLAGKTKQALRSLRGLKHTGTEATLVLWAICRELRELANLFFQKQQGISLNELLQRQWQQRRPLLKQALTRLSAPKVNELLLLAETVDLTIKGLNPGKPWDALEQLTLKMAG